MHACKIKTTFGVMWFVLLWQPFANCDELAQIVSTWKSRQAFVKNAVFEWTERHKETKDSIELDYKMTTLMIVDASNIRYEVSGNRFIEGFWKEEGHWFAFNGTSNVHFSPPNRERNYPFGLIYAKGDPPAALIVMHTTPVLAAIRPLDTTLKGVNLEDLFLEPGEGVIEGSRCIILRVWKRRSLVRQWWVDPALKYAVVRINTLQNGILTRQFDIAYDMVNGVPLPKSWSIQLPTRGRTVESTVTRREINTSKVTARDFQIEFPIGTLVTDMSDPKKGVVDYVIKIDDPKRVITRSEASAGYEQWLATESGQAKPNNSDQDTQNQD